MSRDEIINNYNVLKKLIDMELTLGLLSDRMDAKTYVGPTETIVQIDGIEVSVDQFTSNFVIGAVTDYLVGEIESMKARLGLDQE